MGKASFAKKNADRSNCLSPSSGQKGIALRPPSYGIAAADHQVDKAEMPLLRAIPRLSMSHFSVSRTQGASRNQKTETKTASSDKSFQASNEEQDKILNNGLFKTHGTSAPLTDPRGIEIKVKASTGVRTAIRTGLGVAGGTAIGGPVGGIIGGLVAGLSPEYRWTQTITTNAPLHGATSPYVDPHPNDDPDGGPFYYTTAEHKSYGNNFYDGPSRRADPTKTLTWDAVLSIASVHLGKRVSILESLKYGFTVNPDGSVSPRAPSSAGSGDVSGHIGTLKSEFSDWSFSRGYL